MPSACPGPDRPPPAPNPSGRVQASARSGGTLPVPARGKTGPLILPVFLPFQGCPHRCAFCNARVIAGDTGTIIQDWISAAPPETDAQRLDRKTRDALFSEPDPVPAPRTAPTTPMRDDRAF